MAFKQFQVAEVGPVTVYKRRGTRSIRLTVTSDGTIKVSQPTWLPYKTGLDYAQSKQTWLVSQLAARRQAPLTHGQLIGRHHRVIFQAQDSDKIRSKVSRTTITITYPSRASTHDTEVQSAARKACVRALRQQAEDYVPERLRYLAKANGFDYKSVQIKLLKSRWGSCDSKKAIVVNLYAMQLPGRLIDYILLHELSHTEELNHGVGFWRRFEEALPAAKLIRKELRRYQPTLLV